MAVVPWAGACFGGFVFAVLLYVLTLDHKASIVHRHAAAACVVWAMGTVLWLPGMVGLYANLGSPPSWVPALGIGMGALILLSSIIGAIMAVLGLPRNAEQR